MKKSICLSAAVGALLLGLAPGIGSASAQALPKYPRLVLIPASPSASDMVTLQLVKGMASNSCMAPTYTNATFALLESPADLLPPMFVLKLAYTQIPVPPGKACTMEYNPTEYGPVFRLGTLAAGAYSVVDGETNTNAGSFTVGQNPAVPGFTIRGVVREAAKGIENAALPGVKVTLWRYSPMYVPLPQPYPADEKVAPAIVARPWFLVDSTVTDRSGLFSLSSVAQGSCQLRFAAAGFSPLALDLSVTKDTSMTVLLLPTSATATVSGFVSQVTCPPAVPPQVDCAVMPLAQCTVTVSTPYVYSVDDSLMGDRVWPGYRTYVAVTDSKGTYTVGDIALTSASQQWTVTARKAGYASETRNVTLTNRATVSVDFALQKAYANSKSVTVDNVTFAVATEKAFYQVGDMVFVRYTITNNNTSATVSYGGFGGNCEYDMAVATPAGRELYRFSEANPVCLKNLVTITVAPGKTLTKAFPGYRIAKMPVAGEKNAALDVSAMLRGPTYAFSTAKVSIRVDDQGTPVAKPVARKTGEAGSSIKLLGGSGIISLSVPSSQSVTVKAFSLDGRTIMTRKQNLAAGTNTVTMQQRLASKGMVLLTVRGGGVVNTSKLNTVR